MMAFTSKVLLLAVSLASLSVVQAQCGPGTEPDGGTTGGCQDCTPGNFSPGGDTACSPCPAGTFNSVPAATGCCSCCAGFFSSSTGSTSCGDCGDPQTSPVGSTSAGACTTADIGAARVDTCAQTGRNCPITTAGGVTGAPVRRRHTVSADDCPLASERLCNGKCIDVSDNMWHCGGCSDRIDIYGKRGADCSILPHVNEVSCRKGSCDIASCGNGYIPSLSRLSCVKDKSYRFRVNNYKRTTSK